MKNLTRQILLIFFVIYVSNFSILAQTKPKCCINGGIVNGKARILPIPEYPKTFESVPTDLIVKIKVTIDESGNVISAKAYSSDKVFWKSAENAAMKAKFAPTLINGENFLIEGTIVYKFVAPKIERTTQVGPCGGGVVNSKAIKLAQPIFPKVQARVVGQVTVQVTIDENGDVVDAKACSGNPFLHKSAVEAAKQSKFPQTKISGVPVKVFAIIIYNYSPSNARKKRSDLASCPKDIMNNGGVLNGKAINFVQPEYPKNKIRASGQVSVQVVVDESGNVSSAVACSGNYLLRKPAVEAAKRLKFPQTMLSGVPVKVSAAVVYNFVPPNSRKKVSKFPPCPSGPSDGNVINGKAINLIQPEYPEEARKARANGQVSVIALVDENGKVVSATAVSGNPLLRSSAVEAARKSTFKPRVDCHGNFVKISGTVIYNFQPQ